MSAFLFLLVCIAAPAAFAKDNCRCAVTFWPETTQQNDCSPRVASTNVANVCGLKTATHLAITDTTLNTNNVRCVQFNSDCDEATLYHNTNGVCSGSSTLLKENVCNTIPGSGPVRLDNCEQESNCKVGGAAKTAISFLVMGLAALFAVFAC